MFDPYVLYNIDMIMMPIYSLDFEGIVSGIRCRLGDASHASTRSIAGSILGRGALLFTCGEATQVNGP